MLGLSFCCFLFIWFDANVTALGNQMPMKMHVHTAQWEECLEIAYKWTCLWDANIAALNNSLQMNTCMHGVTALRNCKCMKTQMNAYMVALGDCMPVDVHIPLHVTVLKECMLVNMRVHADFDGSQTFNGRHSFWRSRAWETSKKNLGALLQSHKGAEAWILHWLKLGDRTVPAI